MAGYSGVALARKLGIEPGSRILARNAPAAYRELLAPLPAGALLVARLTPRTDVVHLFSTDAHQLSKALTSLRTRIGSRAALWVSWPKQSSRVATDITEDTIRAIALPLGFVDVKVCAVDDVWSGLKLVIRKELRTNRKDERREERRHGRSRRFLTDTTA
ncbi:MAG TPA: hypothetical protein VFX12_14395 [Vicinamibacterales bacterium]|nr:hypothetical protein [Vicinamibacterales bacterium]